MRPADDRPDSEHTDRLLDRARAGDRAAVNALLARDRDDLRLFLDWRIDAAVRPRVDASDLVNEVQMEIVRRLPEYLAAPPMPYRAWIRKTARERWINVYHAHRAECRDVRREDAPPDSSAVAFGDRFVGRDPAPGDDAVRREQAGQVARAFAVLEPDDREVLHLRHYDGLPYEEVAAVIGITPATARKRYGRALDRLEAALTAQGFAPEDR